MATSGELAATLSRVLGIKPGTVNFYGQQLRDARMLSTSGRGPSAADMRREDVVNWLVALCSAETAKSAADTTKNTLTTPIEKSGESRGGLRFVHAENVGELISALLDDEEAGRLDEILVDLSFRVGGGQVTCTAKEYDDEGMPIWTCEMRFSFSPERLGGSIRRRDNDERPVNADMQTVNKISRTTLQKLSAVIGA